MVVVLSHYITTFYYALYTGKISDIKTYNGIELIIGITPLNLVYAGNFAVCIFFVMSGYILTYRYFQSKDQRLLISGSIRRYFRLLIPILFSLIIAYLFMNFSLFYNKQVGLSSLTKFWSFAPSLFGMLEQAFVGVFFNNQSSYNVVLWTITIEFLGSMMVFGMASLFGNSKNRYIIYGVAALLLIKTYYLAFVLGMILADLYNSKKENLFSMRKVKTTDFSQ